MNGAPPSISFSADELTLQHSELDDFYYTRHFLSVRSNLNKQDQAAENAWMLLQKSDFQKQLILSGMLKVSSTAHSLFEENSIHIWM